MLARLAYAAIAGILVFLLALLLLPVLTLETSPWAALLGILSAIVVFFGYKGRL